jgi:hypothetical protein
LEFFFTVETNYLVLVNISTQITFVIIKLGMAKSSQKIKARALRKEGKSIKVIAKSLGISSSSASLWCRDIILSESQIFALSENANKNLVLGRRLGSEMHRNKKKAAICEAGKIATEKVGTLSEKEFFIAGVALYWAEGSKKESGVALSNSDPKMILFMYKWFKKFFELNDSDFMPRIFINAQHKDRIDKVLTFWSSLLELPSERFGKAVLLNIPHKKVYENRETYYGVLSLRVRKSTWIKYQILGMIGKLDYMSG